MSNTAETYEKWAAAHPTPVIVQDPFRYDPSSHNIWRDEGFGVCDKCAETMRLHGELWHDDCVDEYYRGRDFLSRRDF